jgi:hypothetical protein
MNMRRCLGSIAAFGVVASVILAPSTAGSQHSCGTVTTPRTGTLRVTITRGPAECGRVKAVAKRYMEGRFTVHGPDGPTGYVTLSGGWRCSVLNQGAASCQHGGSPTKPHEEFKLVTP